jgi:chromatin modification-related protein YNG2
VHPPPQYSKNEADAEEGGDLEEEENEDETLYCFCQKQSYGDVRVNFLREMSHGSHFRSSQMIACDNDDGCPYEWVCFSHSPFSLINCLSSFIFSS